MSEPPIAAQSDSSRHAISVLIVAAAILWNVAAFVSANQANSSWPNFTSQCTFAIAFGQVGLACGYVVWGRLSLALRFLVLLAMVYVSSRLTAKSDNTFPMSAWLGIYLAMSVASIAALSVIRCLGVVLEHASLPASRLRRFQFSLLSLIFAMTAVALFAAVVRLATPPFSLSKQNLWPVTRFLLAETLIFCVCIVMPLAFHNGWAGMAIAVLATFVSSVILFGMPDQTDPVVFSSTIEGLFVALVAVVLRFGGYRLVRRSPIDNARGPRINRETVGV